MAALESSERILLCLDRETGKILRQKTALASPLESLHKLNSNASSTPATDGEQIYVSFLDREEMFIAAYDSAGNKLWERRPGAFSSKHGYCSSPILWKDKVKYVLRFETVRFVLSVAHSIKISTPCGPLPS